MAAQFKIILSRYKDGETRFSVPQWAHVEDFDAALLAANNVLIGLRGADSDSRYAVHSVEVVGHRGIQCDGARMFETQAELTARVAGKQKED